MRTAYVAKPHPVSKESTGRYPERSKERTRRASRGDLPSLIPSKAKRNRSFAGKGLRSLRSVSLASLGREDIFSNLEMTSDKRQVVSHDTISRESTKEPFHESPLFLPHQTKEPTLGPAPFSSGRECRAVSRPGFASRCRAVFRRSGCPRDAIRGSRRSDLLPGWPGRCRTRRRPRGRGRCRFPDG